MATVINNQNNTLTVQLTPVEVQTISLLQDDSLSQYLTLWLAERARIAFSARFALLNPADQALVLAKFANKGAP